MYRNGPSKRPGAYLFRGTYTLAVIRDWRLFETLSWLFLID